MAVPIVEGVYWVGVVDWGLRRFHGYELTTPRGSTYNSYLIRDEKTAIVDTVWRPFAGEYIDNLKRVVDLAEIDVIVAPHAEPDHAGALELLLSHCPQAEVVVSQRGVESIPGYIHRSSNLRPVKTGDKIPLGKCELVFVEVPMLHWPDNMMTYVAGKNVLLSQDAFGQHYATAYRFNDQVDRAALYEEALRYYANILTPFSDFVLKKIEELKGLNLPIDVIAPSHGVIWRDDPMQIVRTYEEWARQEAPPSAVVIYDTMWESTRRMAEAVSAGLSAAGLPHKVFHAAASDRNTLIVEIFQSRAIVIGSSTVNGGPLPTLAPLLEDMRGLKFKNKIGAAFGSYGWSGEAVKQIEEHFAKCKIPVAAPGVRAKWNPTAEDLRACEELGRAVAAAALGK